MGNQEAPGLSLLKELTLAHLLLTLPGETPSGGKRYTPHILTIILLLISAQ